MLRPPLLAISPLILKWATAMTCGSQPPHRTRGNSHCTHVTAPKSAPVVGEGDKALIGLAWVTRSPLWPLFRGAGGGADTNTEAVPERKEELCYQEELRKLC